MQVLKHDGSRRQGVGIVPTVLIEPTLKGTPEGRDEVLDKTVEVLAGQDRGEGGMNSPGGLPAPPDPPPSVARARNRRVRRALSDTRLHLFFLQESACVRQVMVSDERD
jgi:hypothetical protein